MGPIEGVVVGLLQGLRHSFEPDHVAAITTLVSDRPRPLVAARTGAAWGLGHAAAILLLGSILIALGVQMPRGVAFALDICVALTFIVLGVLVLRARPSNHAHDHPHDAAALQKPRSRARSTIIGFVHGAAGTGAITLLYLPQIANRLHAVLFLVTFAGGATVSMSILSGLVAAPIGAVAARGASFARGVRIAAAVLSFASAIFVGVIAFTG